MASARLIPTTTPSSRWPFRSPSCYGINSETRNFGNFQDKREKSPLSRDSAYSECQPLVKVKAAVAASKRATISEPKTDGGDLASNLARKIIDAGLVPLKVAAKRRSWKLHPQMLLERVLMDCRFFTLFGIVGSLVGSVLCFVEGCFAVIRSYFQYFHALSKRSPDLGHVVEPLIEALDVFLIGTAMIMFGMGLHVMFVGAKQLEAKGSRLPASNFFGLFYLKSLPRWAVVGSVAQAKSKMGHAVMMIMQVILLEKFKARPWLQGRILPALLGPCLFPPFPSSSSRDSPPRVTAILRP